MSLCMFKHLADAFFIHSLGVWDMISVRTNAVGWITWIVQGRGVCSNHCFSPICPSTPCFGMLMEVLVSDSSRLRVSPFLPIIYLRKHKNTVKLRSEKMTRSIWKAAERPFLPWNEKYIYFYYLQFILYFSLILILWMQYVILCIKYEM